MAQPHIVPRRQASVGQSDFAAPPKPTSVESQEVLEHVMNETISAFQTDRYSAAQMHPNTNRHSNQQFSNNARQTPSTAPRKDYYTRRDEKSSPSGSSFESREPVRQPETQQVESEKDVFVSRVNLPGESREPESNNFDRVAQQQFQLPKSSNRVDNAKPVSVLSKSNRTFTEPDDSDWRTDEEMSELTYGPENSEFVESLDVTPVSSGNRLRGPRSFQDEDVDSTDEQDFGSSFDSDEMILDDFDSSTIGRDSNPLRKSCDEFRSELLNNPITDIALDVSPPGKLDTLGPRSFRTWRDQYGNELADGTISDLRRVM